MENILIPCPECGKELRLRDRKLLGRVGKCPKCSHRFKLEEPDEVELQLADDYVAPAEGTSAKWVPDAPAQAASPAVATVDSPAAGSAFPASEPETSGLNRLRSSRKKRSNNKMPLIISAAVVGVLAIGIGIWAAVSGPAEKKDNGDQNLADKDNSEKTSDPAPENNQNGEVEQVASSKPPAGQPIQLKFLPSGARMIIHLRPAELWKSNSDGETIRLCLGPVGTWGESKLKEILLFEPSLIEEATICLFMDDRNAPPEIACYVKLTELQQPSTFTDKFGGKVNVEFGRKIYIADETDEKPATAYMITDQVGKEFASAPKLLAEEMVNAEQSPGLAAGSLDQLLKLTNDKKHLTILFDPMELRNMKEQLFQPEILSLLGHFLDRFEDTKIESMAWSFYFGGKTYDKFQSEILLRNKSAISSRELQDDMNKKLESFATQLISVVKQMTPTIVAEQKLIGRLPIMFKAFHVETRPAIGGPNEKLVRLTTVLPKIAGPNLAAGTMYAWRLAQNTDFSKTIKTGPSGKLPELITDRIQLPIDVDFRRMPLQEAIEYIAEESQVRIEIDGDALKDSGYTKNMPQTFNLGVVPARRALFEIVKKYGQMVLIVDEKSKLITVMTIKFAEAKGLKPFDLKP